MRSFLKLNGSLIVVWAAIICFSSAVLAQGLGSISGTVTDSTGAVISGAEVTATQAGTGIALKTVSLGSGGYVFPSLAPSVYDITAGLAGFET